MKKFVIFISLLLIVVFAFAGSTTYTEHDALMYLWRHGFTFTDTLPTFYHPVTSQYILNYFVDSGMPVLKWNGDIPLENGEKIINSTDGTVQIDGADADELVFKLSVSDTEYFTITVSTTGALTMNHNSASTDEIVISDAVTLSLTLDVTGNTLLAGTCGITGLVSLTDLDVDGLSDLDQVDVDGGVSVPYKIVTSTYTAVAATDYTIVYSSTVLGTVILPDAGSCTGTVFIIVDGSTGDVVIDGHSTQTISGSETVTLATQYFTAEIQSDGSNWWILAEVD